MEVGQKGVKQGSLLCPLAPTAQGCTQRAPPASPPGSCLVPGGPRETHQISSSPGGYRQLGHCTPGASWQWGTGQVDRGVLVLWGCPCVTGPLLS